MRNDSNAVSNLCLPNAVDVGLHESSSDLLALVLRLHGEGMNGDCATAFFVTNSLSALERPALVLPVGGKSH